MRNAKQRHDAKEEQVRAAQNRLESQVFHARCPQSPEVLVFHPFEPHLAVALKDYFGYLNFHIMKKVFGIYNKIIIYTKTCLAYGIIIVAQS